MASNEGAALGAEAGRVGEGRAANRAIDGGSLHQPSRAAVQCRPAFREYDRFLPCQSMGEWMNGKVWLLAGLAAASIAVSAQAQTGDREAAAKAVLEATDQFARAYGAGAAPRTEVRGALANP